MGQHSRSYEIPEFEALGEEYTSLEEMAAKFVDVFSKVPKLKHSSTSFIKEYLIGELFTLNGVGDLNSIDFGKVTTFPKGPSLVTKYFECGCCVGRTFLHSDFEILLDAESERWNKEKEKTGEVINFSIIRPPLAVVFSYPTRIKSENVQKIYIKLCSGGDIFVYKHEIVKRIIITKFAELERNFHDGYCSHFEDVSKRLNLGKENAK